MNPVVSKYTRNRCMISGCSINYRDGSNKEFQLEGHIARFSPPENNQQDQDKARASPFGVKRLNKCSLKAKRSWFCNSL